MDESSRLLRKLSELATRRMGLPPSWTSAAAAAAEGSLRELEREGLSGPGRWRVGLVVMTGTAETGRLGCAEDVGRPLMVVDCMVLPRLGALMSRLVPGFSD